MKYLEYFNSNYIGKTINVIPVISQPTKQQQQQQQQPNMVISYVTAHVIRPSDDLLKC